MVLIEESVNCDFGKAIEFSEDLDKSSGEWELFFNQHNLRHLTWRRRLEKWRIHFAIYQKIANDGAADINSMFQHLTVLDGKFSLALALNSFVLTAVTFILTHIADLTSAIGSHVLRENVGRDLSILGWIVAALCLGNMWNCLKGVRRIVWGDLGHWVEKKIDVANDFKVHLEGDLDWVHDDHAKLLIIAIAKRTNRFRIATYLSKAILVLMIILFLCFIVIVLFSKQINAAFL